MITFASYRTFGGKQWTINHTFKLGYTHPERIWQCSRKAQKPQDKHCTSTLRVNFIFIFLLLFNYSHPHFPPLLSPDPTSPTLRVNAPHCLYPCMSPLFMFLYLPIPFIFPIFPSPIPSGHYQFALYFQVSASILSIGFSY